MNNINLKTEQLKKELVELINNYATNLPVANIYLIFKDIYSQVERAYDETLAREAATETQSSQEPASETAEPEPAPQDNN